MSGKFIDAYAVLEIGPDADDAAVRARHRELAKQFHPDRGGRAADGELMMRINRARDVLLDPVARATLDEELARRRREASTPPGTAGTVPEAAAGTPPLSRDRRWRSAWTTPPADSSTPGPVPPAPARVRPSANRLRQATRQARAANPVFSSRLRTAAPKPPPTVTETPRPQPAAPQPPNPQPVAPQPVAPQPVAPQPAAPQQPNPAAEKPAHAWSLYAAPLDGVSVASLLASVLMCGPLGLILGIIGLFRTADDKRRGRWAAIAGLAISSLTILVAIGYVMQAMSSPTP